MSDDDVARNMERINQQLNYMSGQFTALVLTTATVLSMLVKRDEHAVAGLADGIRAAAESIADSRDDVPRPSDVAFTGLLHTMREVADKLASDSDRSSIDHSAASS